MNIDNIKSVIRRGESNTVEFKKSTAQLKSAGETLCAFLNGQGGIVFVGVTDKGNIIGQQVTERTQREVGSILAKLAPEANVDVSYIDVSSNKQLVVLHAKPHTDLQPYTFDGKAYARLESSTYPMSRDQHQRLSFKNMQRSRSWEDGIVDDATIDDLDIEKILNTVNEGIANKRIPADQMTDNPEIVLKRFGLLKNKELINAAIVLFAKEPTHWLPQCSIRLARFRGIDKQEFIDSKVVNGNAFKLISEAMVFADRYLPVSSKFNSGDCHPMA